MENGIIRSLYRLLPFMFLFQIFAIVSVVWILGSAGGLDLSTASSPVPGLSATCILLPLTSVLTIINLVVFPRLKSEEPAMLLFLTEIIFSGALAVQASRIWFAFIG